MSAAASVPASRRIRVAELAQLRSRDGGAAVWQGDQLAVPARPACPTGFAALDAELPGGGWPAAGLTELLLDAPGAGELQLLGPGLARCAVERPLVWVAPPLPPYAPALQALGLPLERLVWLDPANAADAAWAAEQVLRGGAAGAVLWWCGHPQAAMLRRLHLAAQEGATPLYALRASAGQHQSSPAPLRLALAPAPGGRLEVHVLKRRGPALAHPITLALPHPARARQAALPVSALPDVVARPAPALAAA
jgi:protein ImuA